MRLNLKIRLLGIRKECINPALSRLGSSLLVRAGKLDQSIGKLVRLGARSTELGLDGEAEIDLGKICLPLDGGVEGNLDIWLESTGDIGENRLEVGAADDGLVGSLHESIVNFGYKVIGVSVDTKGADMGAISSSGIGAKLLCMGSDGT